MHDLAALLGRQLPGTAADEPGQLRGVEPHHPARHDRAAGPAQVDDVPATKSPSMPWMPAASSDRRRSSTAVTAPASRSSAPRTSAACRSQNRRADIRRPDGRNAVPIVGPAGSSAAPTCSAAVSSTGMPDAAAIAAAVIFVAIPPVPRPLPAAAVLMPARSVGASTSVSRRAPGRRGSPS